MTIRFRMHSQVIEYQLYALFAYLLAITITTSMKFTLPIYIVLVMIPFVGKIRHLDYATISIVIISIVYILFGLLFQDVYETITSFLSKVFQFVIFMVILINRRSICKQTTVNIKKLLPLCFAAESILGVYLATHGSLIDASGLTRLTAGRQPVAGNLTITLLPLMIWGYFNDPSCRKSVIIWGSCCAIWIFLSGTRGYMLLYAFSMGLVYWDYFFTLSKRSQKKAIKVFVAMVFVLGCLFLLLLRNHSIVQQVEQMLRLDAGVGGRDNENAIAIGFFKNTTLPYKLFGIGFGGIAADAPGYIQSVAQNTYSVWGFTHYSESVGTSFHNLYSNYILLQGVTGCIEIFVFAVWGFQKIRRLQFIRKREKHCYLMYWIGFFVMNYFRWSCDCGISEMVILALTLSLQFNRYDQKFVSNMMLQRR